MTTLRLPATRWGAFAGHVLISVLIFLVLFAVIYFLLFPGALFTLAGGIDGIKIVAGVDVVLGPLLTLIIYNVAKPRRELVRDLTIIGGVQIAALAAGMWVVYGSRPVVVSYIYDSFHAVRASEFERAEAAPPAGGHMLSPAFYYTELPEDPKLALSLMAQYEMQPFPIGTRSDLMQPLPSDLQQLEAVFRFTPDAAKKLGSDCIPTELVSAFGGGSVCFDSRGQRLRHR